MRLGPIVAVVGSVVVLSCAPEAKDTPSPPTNASYSIVFPSTATAVAADSVEIIAFDATDALATNSDCLTLITKQKSQADLPKAPVLLGRTEITSVCTLLGLSGSDAGAASGVLSELSYGKRSILAIARRQGQDFLVGCASGEITSAASVLEINVLPVNETTVVPTTTCTSVSDKCKGACN